jgi:hypothetical protein
MSQKLDYSRKGFYINDLINFFFSKIISGILEKEYKGLFRKVQKMLRQVRDS